MANFNKIVKILIFILISFSAHAHVNHYDSLKKIEFDIYRNNKPIGKHIFTFTKSESKLIVKSEINFEIKKLGVVLYKYKAQGTEVFEDGKLIKFNSTTKQNKKEKYVNLELVGNEYNIDGSSFKGKAPNEYELGTWWNHSLVKSKAQISAVSGRIIHQKVEFLEL